MKVRIITDVHHAHGMLIEAGHRPANYMDRLIKSIQQEVKQDDVLVNLGDLVLHSKTIPDGLLPRCRSNILIMGNHDRRSKTFYYKLGYDVVSDGIVLGNALLTHIPTIPSKGMVNVHGHWHQRDNSEFYPGYNSSRQYCVSLEKLGYRTISLDVILGELTRRSRKEGNP